MTIGNGGKGAKNNGEDDDEDPEDKKALGKLERIFADQARIVRQLFDFVQVIYSRAPETAETIRSYPELERMFVRGMLQAENPQLRRQICTRMREGIAPAVSRQDPSAQKLNQRILDISLFKLLA